jgi:hypothetical protein
MKKILKKYKDKKMKNKIFVPIIALFLGLLSPLSAMEAENAPTPPQEDWEVYKTVVVKKLKELNPHLKDDENFSSSLRYGMFFDEKDWQGDDYYAVYLREFKLKALPTEISNFPKLTCLELENNELTDIPSEITNLTNLKELGLEGNKFSEIPQLLTEFKSLKIVNLIGNPLKLPIGIFPDWTKNLSNVNVYLEQTVYGRFYDLGWADCREYNLSGIELVENHLETTVSAQKLYMDSYLMKINGANDIMIADIRNRVHIMMGGLCMQDMDSFLNRNGVTRPIYAEVTEIKS